MTKDNSTSKNKEFYDLGKKMFDRLNPHISHNPKVVGPEQKPVAWICEGSASNEKHAIDYWPGDVDDIPIGTPLYTTPPQRTWVGLTEVEMKQTCYEVFSYDPYTIARAIEAKLRSKNA